MSTSPSRTSNTEPVQRVFAAPTPAPAPASALAPAPSPAALPVAIAPPPPPAVEQVVARVPDPEPVQRTTEVQQPEAPPQPGPQPQQNPEELLRKLYDPLLRRLKADLWLDRERRGALTDL